MLKVPLESRKSRKNSFSSIGDDSFDPRRMTVIIDDQSRLIRKLKLKVSKLENNLEKKKEESRKIKASKSSTDPLDVQFSLFKTQLERIELLEETLDKVNDSVVSLLNYLIQEKTTKSKKDLPTLSSYKSLPSQEKLCNKQFSVQRSLDQNIEMILNNFATLQNKLRIQNTQMNILEEENKMLKKQLRVLEQDRIQSQELKQVKQQYQAERKKCLKLKSLLEKSQYERNNMFTQMHKISQEQRKKGKTYEDLVCLSESLNVRVKDLESQKQSIVEDSLKEQNKWQQHYKNLLTKVRTSVSKKKEQQK